MLNINQNFDLKAPVFNFDRDYFNSVEELNAYDASNVPDHFVTNVAGMLYQFTDGGWRPMIGTEADTEGNNYVNLGCGNAYIMLENNEFPSLLEIDGIDGSEATLSPSSLSLQSGGKNISIDTNYDGNTPGITLSDGGASSTIIVDNNISCGDDSFKVDIYGDEGRIEINDAQGRCTNYSASGFSGQTKDNTASYSLNLPSKNADTVSLSLKNADCSTKLSTDSGLTVTSDEGFTTNINNQSFSIQVFNTPAVTLDANTLLFSNTNNTTALKLNASNGLILGNDDKVKFSRLTNTEGAVISGIKSLTAFANPSATKVWATDGSTVDLTTKANASDLDAKANKSDVLLKKSASGGYYIEGYTLLTPGEAAFVANKWCTADGTYSFAEGNGTTAKGTGSHAEGVETHAYKFGAHAEGNMTMADGVCSHAEGYGTAAYGEGSHAQGMYNVKNENAIHSIGIGIGFNTRKNSEFVYYNKDNQKNGYKYLIGVGGYDGISTDNTTYKSVQEVIADLTARIEQLETKVKTLEAANTPA